MRTETLKTMVKASEGRFFSISFIKADGTRRELNGRVGVIKHLNGGESTTSHIPQILTVFDTKIQAYRNVYLNRVIKAHIDGIDINVQSEEEARAQLEKVA